MIWDMNAEELIFQFPPPRGGERRNLHDRDERASNFNSRPREGANEIRPGTRVSAGDFNSRPREGANVGRGESFGAVPDFNSRPREGAN